LSGTETVFVGANNSGKTSAMDAIRKFLKGDRPFALNDLTLSNRKAINEIGEKWLDESYLIEENLNELNDLLPSLDIWLNVEDNEIHYVSHMIPTLNWTGGTLGVRFAKEPKDSNRMVLEYIESYNRSREVENSQSMSRKPGDVGMHLWPKNLSDFLEKKLNDVLGLKYYLLDPSKKALASDGTIPIQETDYNSEFLDGNPLTGLIKINTIDAQRGFSDPESNENGANSTTGDLSNQLRKYYDKHLDPQKMPSVEDIKTLEAMESATQTFNKNLEVKFKSSIGELEALGYPGFNNPKISIKTKVNASESLKHDSAVQYALTETSEFRLPEKFNGLGYQNLVSMVFLLIAYRDSWLRIGKDKKKHLEEDFIGIEPIHLVLLEEPEAHLHIQAQQVFISKAYGVLRNNDLLGESPTFTTQLVISSHSSHIAQEVKFSNLRYFKRLPDDTQCDVPTSKVVNLSEVFGEGVETDKFVSRYLLSTHCELFFADAAILVEGATERMLLPHFIRNKYNELNRRYITILEINGSHAHRLKPLIDKLSLNTLIITDLDSAKPTGHHSGARPELGKKLVSKNSTINKLLLQENGAKLKSIDDLLKLEDDKKIIATDSPFEYSIRVAYQTPTKVKIKGSEEEAISSSF
ncbi:ATP-dependent endonuclease, partial [Listeria monocytogenes]|nr:ATP-dependent endonuclease [Listeria monocytogenes]